jgi:hypothetical protein
MEIRNYVNAEFVNVSRKRQDARSRFNFLLEFSVEVRTPLAKRPRQNPSNPKT